LGGSGKNSSGSSGSGKGGSKGDGGTKQQTPIVSPRAERARGRQERAAARQAARQQRRSADQVANLADRSRDRDQDRANRQAEREQRRAAKAERKAARQAKREAAENRTTLGAAVMEGVQDRWDKRRAGAKDDDKAAKKDSTDPKDSEAPTKKPPKDSPQAPSGGPKGGSAPKKPGDGKKSGEKPSDGSGAKAGKGSSGTGEAPKPDDAKTPPDEDLKDDPDDDRSFYERVKDYFRRPDEPSWTGKASSGAASGSSGAGRRGGAAKGKHKAPGSPFGPEDSAPTVEWPEHPTGPPRPAGDAKEGEDIVDADIVPDEPAAVTTGVRGLPPAPEPHTQRPGTTRSTAQEDPMSSEVSRPTSGQAGMAARHRTDITFGEYLTEIVNIAIAASLDKDRAQELAVSLGKVADALRDMAADLAGDHNIATEVVNDITDTADTAMHMKQMAERCATECDIASDAARIAAASVGRVYGEDIKAMDDAGLAHASAAAHHD
jgi:hypothetical protein